MNDKVKNFYENNYLYHRKVVLPEMGEIINNSCDTCKFYVSVIGQHATQKVCLASVKAYNSGRKRVPTEIQIVDLMLLLGKEVLENMVNKKSLDKSTCGKFEKNFTINY